MNENDYADLAEGLTKNVPTLPKGKGLVGLLGERESHRQTLFNFACYLTIASFYLLAGIVIVQMFQRVWGNETFEVVDSTTFNILAVSVFGQIVGVIYIIAKALWDGKEFEIFSNKSQK